MALALGAALGALLAHASAVSLRGVSPCACLSWREQALLHEEECTKLGTFTCALLSRVDTVCVNNKDVANPYQHCLVKPECKDLNGGEALAFGLSIKRCRPGQDPMLRSLSLFTLERLASQYQVDLGVLAKFAYPSLNVTAHGWKVAKEFWGIPDNLLKTSKARMSKTEIKAYTLLSHEMELLRQLVNTTRKAPVIINGVDDHLPFGVLDGDRIFEVTRKNVGYFADRNYSVDNAYLFSNVKCLRGCTSVARLNKAISKTKEHHEDSKRRMLQEEFPGLEDEMDDSDEDDDDDEHLEAAEGEETVGESEQDGEEVDEA